MVDVNGVAEGASPLAGIRVLDFSHAIFGSLATRLLADFGAEVVKVERPDGGDFYRARRPKPDGTPGPDSARWLSVNYNKRSVALDLGRRESRPTLERLVSLADVVIHNFRPPIALKLGIDAASMLAVNPRLVYCSLSGYGEDGPNSNRRSGDPYAQAVCGAVAASGSPGKPPSLGTTMWVDHGGAALAAFGILLGLQQRQRTGHGCTVDSNLVDTAFFFQTSSTLQDYLLGAPPQVKGGRGASGGFPWGVYAAEDGDVVTFHGGADADWPLFCEIMGLPELGRDSRYDRVEKRQARREELYDLLDPVFASATRAEWMDRFREGGLRCDPALTYAEAEMHPQVIHNQILTECPGSDGPFKTVGTPVRLNGIRPKPRLAPPDIGEQSREIMADWGFSEAEIEELVRLELLGARPGAMAAVEP